jgi:hypothetical protein
MAAEAMILGVSFLMMHHQGCCWNMEFFCDPTIDDMQKPEQWFRYTGEIRDPKQKREMGKY